MTVIKRKCDGLPVQVYHNQYGYTIEAPPGYLWEGDWHTSVVPYGTRREMLQEVERHNLIEMTQEQEDGL